MNSILIYDSAVVSYLKTIQIADGDVIRNPQVLFAIPSRHDTKLTKTDNDMPLLPMLVVIRQSLEKNDFSGIVKNRLFRPYIYQYSDKKDKIYGIDAMPYYFNYKIESWHLTQESYIDMLNKLIWKFEKERVVKAKLTLSNIDFGINGYIEDSTISDDTTYEEISQDSIRLIKGSFTIKMFGWLFDDNYVEKTVLKNIQKTVISKSGNINEKSGFIEDGIDTMIANTSTEIAIKRAKLDGIKGILQNLISQGNTPIYTDNVGRTWNPSILRDHYILLEQNSKLNNNTPYHRVEIDSKTDEDGNIIERTEKLL